MLSIKQVDVVTCAGITGKYRHHTHNRDAHSERQGFELRGAMVA